jgi:electron transport complex protein RnfD
MFSARRLNDGMGDYVANQVVKCMNKKGILVKDSKILILGITFKENCPDVRNTKVVDIVKALQEYNLNITIYDPWANPAIAGRVFATLSWPTKMQTWLPPFSSDGLTAATPLSAVQSALLNGGNYGNESSIQLLDTLSGDVLRSQIDYLRMFFGFRGGCIGEVSAFLLILAALFLLYRKIITIDIPVSFLSTAAIMAWIFEGTKFGGPLFTGDPLFHLLSGGMILAAFFMATDVVTTPLTTKGRIIFGIGCGMITMLIRIWGSYAEGVGLAILFMNMLSPAIDRYVRNYPAGWHKKRKKLNEN